MTVVDCIWWGAAGGCVVALVTFFTDVTDWQSACRQSLRKRTKRPKVGEYVLVGPDAFVLLLRAVFGAFAGWVFHHQVTGDEAAIAVGAAGPALFRQFGLARTVQEALQGAGEPDDPKTRAEGKVSEHPSASARPAEPSLQPSVPHPSKHRDIPDSTRQWQTPSEETP